MRLQKDLNLTQDVGTRVQVTGHLLEGKQLRTDTNETAQQKPVGTTGQNKTERAVFGVTDVQQSAGACSPETPKR